ncbi:IS1380 family transposase [Candidatus Poriferisodalis sp.]|uniref:IS1380 family transposase n=1 Tax=Candidatus Poriferisodalis sp. TaxID=3101277 RepID=UPI003C704A4B
MSASSRSLDRFATTFDHEGLVANAGLIVAGTLMARLGLLALIERWVRTGSANPGPKIANLVAAMVAGATHIDHVEMLRAGRTGAVLGFTPVAPSTVGSFLRTFTFGHVRQLEAVLSRTLARAWRLGAGPGAEPLVVDVDSTICEVHGKQKHGAAYGYTKALGYHPLLAARADTGEVLAARMRKGSAGSARGVLRFVDELVANLRRAGASGPLTVRADSGFWSWKLIDRLDAHGAKWSITVTLGSAVRAAIEAIPDTAWADIDYTDGGHAQVAETAYVTGGGTTKRRKRTVRLVVRRTRLAEGAQRRLWPHWRHHAFITNTEHRTVAADEFHRGHAVVELAIRDLKEGSGLEHVPSGHYGANCAWLTCAALAHNIGHWSAALAAAPPATNRCRRTRLVALAAVLVNRSGTPTLRYPARWPWATQFQATLTALRALPGPSG